MDHYANLVQASNSDLKKLMKLVNKTIAKCARQHQACMAFIRERDERAVVGVDWLDDVLDDMRKLIDGVDYPDSRLASMFQNTVEHYSRLSTIADIRVGLHGDRKFTWRDGHKSKEIENLAMGFDKLIGMLESLKDEVEFLMKRG